MYKKLKLKSLKLFIWLVFLLYLVVLINVIILKGGNALIIARHLINEISWTQKIAGINFIPLKTIFYYLSGNQSSNIAIENLLGNILVFSPMGFLLPMLFDNCKKLKNTFFISFLVSLSFEIIQLIFCLGSCDIDDLILNVLGSILGFESYKVLNHMVKRYLKVTS